MNELTKQLWVQATRSSWPRPTKLTTGEYDCHLEEFAEFIVLECIELVNIWSNEEPCSEGYDILAVHAIKERFGIKDKENSK